MGRLYHIEGNGNYILDTQWLQRLERFPDGNYLYVNNEKMTGAQFKAKFLNLVVEQMGSGPAEY